MASGTTRRFAPRDLVDLSRGLVPMGLLVLAAGVPILRLPVLLALAAGTLVAVLRLAPVRWAWAGSLPVALSLVTGAWLVAPAPPGAGALDCADPTSPIAVTRVVEAVLVLALVAVLANRLRAAPSTQFLVRPSRPTANLAIGALLIVTPAAVLLGPWLAEPFFGPVVGYELGAVRAVVPAAMFAVANALMEEVAYRGALLGWGGRVAGLAPAIVLQAIVFGLAHAGPEVVAFAGPQVVLLGLAGLVAGVVTVRTGSLAVPLAVHVAADVALYLGLAC